MRREPRGSVLASDAVTQVTIPTKNLSRNDKPMTIETAIFLEYSRDRPTGHPESSARGAGQHARGAQQPRMANLSAPHFVSKFKRQPRRDRSRRGWQSYSANGGCFSG